MMKSYSAKFIKIQYEWIRMKIIQVSLKEYQVLN